MNISQIKYTEQKKPWNPGIGHCRLILYHLNHECLKAVIKVPKKKKKVEDAREAQLIGEM